MRLSRDFRINLPVHLPMEWRLHMALPSTEPTPAFRRLGPYWPEALILVAVALVWGQTLRFEFVWDDLFFIERLQSIRSLDNVPEMFTSLAAQSSKPEEFVLFRPLRTLVYAILFQLGGGEPPKPWLFHLCNLVWHGIASILLYRVARRLFTAEAEETPEAPRTTSLALFAALAFALNPVVSETVCWAKSLDDLMATTFVLASLLCLLCRTPSARPPWLAVIFFLLAVYSKMSAVPWALAVWPVLRWFHRLPWKHALGQTLAFVAVAMVFLVHNHLVIGRTSQTAPLSGSYVQTWIDMFPVVPVYARLLCGLPPFCADYNHFARGHAWTAWPVIGGAALLFAGLGLVWWLSRSARGRWAAFGLAWVGLFLLPVSNLVPMMQYLAERFLYLPLVGWVVALASGVQAFRPRAARVVTVALLLFWAATAVQRSWIWRDNLTLFVETWQAYPENDRLKHNAVAAGYRLPSLRHLFVSGATPSNDYAAVDDERIPRASWADAAETLRTLTNLIPREHRLLSGLGIAQARAGEGREAAETFRAAARLQPKNALLWANLGQALFEAGQLEAAQQAVEQALILNPDQRNALRTRFAILWQQRNDHEALAVSQRLSQLEPTNAEHRVWMDKVRQRINAPQR